MYKILGIFLIFLLIFSCSEPRDTITVATHPPGWNNENYENFHGEMVLESVLGNGSCTTCHGVDFRGGSSGSSCFSSGCHQVYPHSFGWSDTLSENFHTKFIADTLKWKIEICQSCHGMDYRGNGAESKNCLVCHTAPEGPEACNTCHGDILNPAPPRDLNGNMSTTSIGVGAHQTHLTDTTLTTAFSRDCNLCHKMPSAYDDAGHIDGQLPAEVVFSSFTTDTNRLNSIWDHETASCSNIYCHGAFVFKKEDAGSNSWIYTDSVIVGNNPTMKWTEVGTNQAECGSCHTLPPEGHLSQLTCNGCHGRVVDENFNIINKSLHINGKVDVF